MQASARAPLRFELLGGFRVQVGEQPAGQALTTRQQELLAYLALNAQRPIPRQQIAESFWPDSTDSQALTNLRRELHHVRHALPEIESVVDTGGRTLAWNAELPFDLDVRDFDRALNAADRESLQRAMAIYRGDLLPGCDAPWVRPLRDSLRRRAVDALARLVQILTNERAFAEAIEQARRLLRLDPLHEATWCALMRCHAERGERATALHTYHRCVAILRREVGIEPGTAVRAAYRDLIEQEEADAASPPQPPRTSTYPLIGRQTEWALARQVWQAAASGAGHLLLIAGEAGIGKTRLAEELIELAASSGARTAATRCYAGEGRLPYAPIIAWLRGDAVQAAIKTLEPAWVTEIARLHPAVLRERPDVTPPEPRLESWQRSAFFEALAHVFAAAAPLLLVVDDVQWCDPDTLEWLHFLFRRTEPVRMLVVGTVRAEEEADNQGLASLFADLRRFDQLTRVDLGPLDERATVRLAEAVAEHALDRSAGSSIFQQTEGHPLFIIETGRMAGTAGIGAEAVPPRVQAVVAERLNQLPADARAVAELAAVVGRDFTFGVLAHVSDLEEDAIVRALDELWRRHIIRVQSADRWDFSHDRVREVAYGGIGPARRRLLHRRVAQALEHLSASTLDDVSASIAAHLEQAGQVAGAIQFFERAADAAVRLLAHEEAIRCCNRAIALVEQAHSGRDRGERELALRSVLAGSLNAVRGYAVPEVESNLVRIAALSSSGTGSIPVRWLWPIWSMRFVMGDLKAARELAEQAFARSEGDASVACEAHHSLAGTLTSMGKPQEARPHFEAAIEAYDEQHPQRSALGTDLGVFAHAWFSHALWLLGESDLARSHAERGIALAERTNHPYSQTVGWAYAGLTYQFMRDVPSLRVAAQRVAALSDQYGFVYYAEWARMLLGWIAAQEGRADEGIALIQAGLDNLDRQCALARRPYYLSLLADAHVAAGDIDRARTIVDRALALADARGDVWWNPELARQKSALESRTLRGTPSERLLS
jgi:DNA-binding SARP family transcriptional activator